MADNFVFESRKGIIKQAPATVFNFASDVRNFERFIPADTVTELVTGTNSCSFRVNMLGKVNIAIREKTEHSKIIYEGDLLQTNTFVFNLFLEGNSEQQTIAHIIVNADLNPMLKMLAAEPVKNLLETLIAGMENFDGWKDIRK